MLFAFLGLVLLIMSVGVLLFKPLNPQHRTLILLFLSIVLAVLFVSRNLLLSLTSSVKSMTNSETQMEQFPVAPLKHQFWTSPITNADYHKDQLDHLEWLRQNIQYDKQSFKGSNILFQTIKDIGTTYAIKLFVKEQQTLKSPALYLQANVILKSSYFYFFKDNLEKLIGNGNVLQKAIAELNEDGYFPLLVIDNIHEQIRRISKTNNILNIQTTVWDCDICNLISIIYNRYQVTIVSISHSPIASYYFTQDHFLYRHTIFLEAQVDNEVLGKYLQHQIEHFQQAQEIENGTIHQNLFSLDSL